MKPVKLSTLRKVLLLITGFSAAVLFYSGFITKQQWAQRGTPVSQLVKPRTRNSSSAALIPSQAMPDRLPCCVMGKSSVANDNVIPFVASRLLKGVTETNITYRRPEQDNIINNLSEPFLAKETAVQPKQKEDIIYYKQVEDLEIFIYSAIIGNSTMKATWDNVVLTGWEHTRYTYVRFTCCLWYKKHGLMSISGIRKHHWSHLGRASLQAKQYVCSNPGRKWGDVLLGITVTTNINSCSNDTNIYVEPIFAYRHRRAKLAICNKIVYGSVSPESILEWFEVQRSLRVDKVLTYANSDLNKEARQVLKYYEAIGMAEVLPFLLPMNDKYRRWVGQKGMQAWNDEQVPVFDCLERLRGYKYMGILDLDEFILPTNDSSLPNLLARLFNKEPWAAGFSFDVHIFVTSWGMTNASAEFRVTQYTNRTKPMMDRVKNIFMPSRIKPGGVSTHTFIADRSRNYKISRCPSYLGAISHYRTCRSEWQRKGRNKCQTFVRYRDTSMVKAMEPIKDRVLQLRKKLGITNAFGKVT